MAKHAVVSMDEEMRLEHTDSRIRAYLAALRPIPGGSPLDSWHRGRAVVERMAIHSNGYDEPKIALTLEECADVLRFIAASEPFEPLAFYSSRANPSPQVGMMFVLRVVSDHLSKAQRRKRAA